MVGVGEGRWQERERAPLGSLDREDRRQQLVDCSGGLGRLGRADPLWSPPVRGFSPPPAWTPEELPKTAPRRQWLRQRVGWAVGSKWCPKASGWTCGAPAMSPEPCGEAQSHIGLGDGRGQPIVRVCAMRTALQERQPHVTEQPELQSRLCCHAPPPLYLPTGLPLGFLETLPKANMLGLTPS